MAWRGGRELAQGLWSGSAGGGGQWGGTGAPGGLVADPKLWGANGNVLALARAGNTLYIAGSFRSVGETSGGFMPLDDRTGEALRPLPKVAGSASTIEPDGSSGWYIDGDFTAVGGGSPDPAWPRSAPTERCRTGTRA